MSTNSENNNKSGKKGNRYQRSQKFRETRGEREMNEYNIKRDQRLYRGFDDLTSLFQQVALATVVFPKMIPITTRGIGFALHWFWEFYSTLNIHLQINRFAIFRTALQQFEKKMMIVNSKTASNRRTAFRSVNMDYRLKVESQGRPLHLSIITDLVNSVGNIVVKDQTYCPMLPILGTKDAMFILTASNLRSTVVNASNPLHPADERERLFETCAIPGSIWLHGVNGWILLNADEICPDEYDVTQFIQDNNQLSTLINALHKHPRLVSRFEEDTEGTQSILVSVDELKNSLATIREELAIPERNEELGEAPNPRMQIMAQFRDVEPQLGSECSAFRSIDDVRSEAFVKGSVQLLGELIHENGLPRYATQCIRVEHNVAKEATLSPHSLLRSMLQ